MNKLAILALAALAVLGAAALLLRSDAEAPAQSDSPSATAAKPAAAPSFHRAEAVPLPARSWKLGVSRVYAFDSVRTLSLAFGSGKNKAGDVALAGNLAMTPIADDGDGVLVHTQLRDARFETSAASAPRPGLEREFIVSFAKDGRVDAVFYPRDQVAATKNELTWMVSALQLAVGEDPRAEQWEVSEQDTTGQYQAAYRRAASASTEVKKSKSHYVEIHESDAQPGDYAVESEEAFELGADGWPETIRLRESSSAAAGGVTIAIDTAATATLVETGDAGALVARADALVAGMVADDFAAAAGVAELRASMDRQLTGGRSLADIVAALRAEADQQKRIAMMFAAAAALRLDPSSLESLESEVRGEQPGDVANVLLGAMGASGLDAAQDALGDLLSDRALPEATRLSATAALAQSASHSPEAVNDLLQVSRGAESDVQRAATLALGAAARSNDDLDQLVDELLERLQNATELGEITVLLGALGNSGDPRALPALEAARGHDNSRIRQEAVEAMRLIADARVDGLLDASLISDPATGVRQAALFAIGFRDFALHTAAFEVVASKEPSEAVRRALVNLLASNLDQAGAHTLLASVAENDASESVRQAAASALAGESAAP